MSLSLPLSINNCVAIPGDIAFFLDLTMSDKISLGRCFGRELFEILGFNFTDTFKGLWIKPSILEIPKINIIILMTDAILCVKKSQAIKLS